MRLSLGRRCGLRIIGILIGLPVIGKIVLQIFKARIRDLGILNGLEKRLSSTRAIQLYVFGKYPRRSAPAEAWKYLFYFAETSAGLEHLFVNLRYFLIDCRQLKRTAVLTKPKLHPIHNRGIALDTSWRKYCDIDRMAKQNGFHLIDYQEFCRKNFSKESVLIVNGMRSITADENRKYPMIIRNVARVGFYSMPGRGFVGCLWSPGVIREAQKVFEQLPQAYCGLHIRRGDRLFIYSSQAKVTEPSHVLKKLREYNPDRLPVFLMTDEQDRTLYKNLEAEFKIYRYYHFPNLVQVAEENDNYFLFAIEQCIQEHAKRKISTANNLKEDHFRQDHFSLSSDACLDSSGYLK